MIHTRLLQVIVRNGYGTDNLITFFEAIVSHLEIQLFI
jgi:hypothetical protein